MCTTDLRDLRVDITNKCNMDCSFCHASKTMTLKNAQTEIMVESVLKVLRENPTVDNVEFAGGEPTLAMRRVREVYKHAQRDFSTQIKRWGFHTNATHLKTADIEFLNQFTRVSVSFDGYINSERPFFKNFIQKGRFEALETLRALDNIDTSVVLTPEQLWNPRWYEDIMDLHKAIYHLGFQRFYIGLDHQQSNGLGTDQLLNLVYGLNALRANIRQLSKAHYKPTDDTVFLIGIQRTTLCHTCARYGMVYPDGSIGRCKDMVPVLGYGCADAVEYFGKEAYKYLAAFIDPNKEMQ